MGALLAKEELEALAKSKSVRKSVDALGAIIDKGMKVAERLIDGDSPDSGVKLSECSTQTRFAMELVKLRHQSQQNEHITERALGVIVLRGRMEAAEWEKHAAAVDEGRDPDAIDVDVVDE